MALDNGFVVLFALWQVQPQIHMLAAHHSDMLVLQVFDVAGTHKAVDHELDQQVQLSSIP